ncbi:response regulator [Paenibacillus sinopodophylli]|uniref:response regulator n=1 Tax=Paenibacillus sinopodophylli TaxID=1837342 RepID=UPI00110C99B4|nr:response regulator [Paenibacillus sinopodophylli]
MIRVLLIDDEEDALDLLEILLSQIGGVEVVGRYDNPIQAIEDIVRFPVDAVFLDNQMPGMKGTKAARAIREKLPRMPIVFTTAYAEYAVEAFEIQSTDYLLKPFTKERLQNAVDRVQQLISTFSLEARRNTSIPFTIRCLGGFHIQLPDNKDRKLAWKTKKEKELCAYLIHYEGKSVNTATIIEALWPGYDLEKAKTYFYTCMSYLRKSLADHQIPIQIHKDAQGFFAALDGMTVDVTEFERLLRSVLNEEVMDERLYDSINLIYKGDYMDASDFGWVVARQLEIKATYIRVLRKWYAYFRSQGQMLLAIDSMKQVLTLAPDSEADGRELIKLHLETGNRNEALRVYMQLEQAVHVQLGAELEEGTVLLLHQTKDQVVWQGRGV